MADFYEDMTIGETDSYGTYEVTADEIVSFGEQYDPQPIHVDEDAASESTFGGLIASGWHTCAMTMRLLVDGFFESARALGAVGVDELRYPAPVRPGHELSVATEVVDKEPWDEDRGVVHCAVETTTAADTTALRMVGLVLWERR